MDVLFQALTYLHDGGLFVASAVVVVVVLAMCSQSACDRLVAIILAYQQRCGCDTCASHRRPKKPRHRNR